jgi:hypothetical protein
VLVKDGFLTLNTVDAPLGVVIQRIGEQADFSVYGHDELVEPVTWSITEVPLDIALRRITRGISFVSVYAPSGGLMEMRIVGAARDAIDNEVSLARTIAKRPGEHTEDALAASFDKDLEQMLEMVDQLIAKGDAEAANLLSQMLSEDEPPRLRRRATIGLGKINDEQAKNALTGVLGDSDAVMRRYAVEALGRNWGRQTVGQLSTVLMNDSDPTVRRLAARALGRMGTIEGLKALHAAQFDPNLSVRQTVTDSLALLDKIGVTLERQIKRQQMSF